MIRFIAFANDGTYRFIAAENLPSAVHTAEKLFGSGLHHVEPYGPYASTSPIPAIMFCACTALSFWLWLASLRALDLGQIPEPGALFARFELRIAENETNGE